MMDANSQDRWTGRLPNLPVAVRIMLTAFLAIIGFGYLTAVANIFFRHELADGKPGLSLDDIRAVYGGLASKDGKAPAAVSRMLTMIRGEMRQYISSESDFTVLEEWLKSGGAEAGLDKGEKRKTPRRVIIRDCLRCHAADAGTDISKKASFGPDEFTVDYARIAGLVGSKRKDASGASFSPPQYTMPHLVLFSHQHMLTIPMFTLVVGLLFMMTRLSWRWRSVLTPLPMVAILLDFSGWWLARLSNGFVVFIVAGGAIFSIAFGAQILIIAWDLWRQPSPPHDDLDLSR